MPEGEEGPLKPAVCVWLARSAVVAEARVKKAGTTRLRLVTAGLGLAALLRPGAMRSELIPVRYSEGVVHGFLALRTLNGESLAAGDLIQFTHGGRVTSQLVFRFKDGSVHDETVVFTQRGNFRLVSDHLVQKGPAFERALDVSLDGKTGRVTVHYKEGGGAEKVAAEQLDLPPDVANGMVLTLLKSIRPETPRTTVSMLAVTPKPRLVNLVITPAGEEPFSIGGDPRKAMLTS